MTPVSKHQIMTPVSKHQIMTPVSKHQNFKTSKIQEPATKPERVLRCDCTHEEFGLFLWASRLRKGWNIAQFFREALAEKVELEATRLRARGRELPDYVVDGIAKFKAAKL